MRIIEPKYVIEQCPTRTEALRQIEEAGRTCYKSEDKITPDSGAKFVRMIMKRGHETVIEHVGMTVRFICNRGISHETVRHRISSLSQESSRYCDYSKGKHGSEITVINDNHKGEALEVWVKVIATCEWGYMRLLVLGIKPEIARNLLPIALKTEIVMTCNMREWRHVFKLRTSPRAHPQMRQLMVPLFEEMVERIPELFEDLLPKEENDGDDEWREGKGDAART